MSTRLLGAAAVAAAVLGCGCAYYFPQNLVATNIRAADNETLVHGGTRLEAEVCGNRLFSIPFGPDPTMDAFIRSLEDQAAGAVGFEDIRIDRVFVNYLFVFWQDCVHGSAMPLFPPVKTRAPKRTPRAAPPVETPPPPPAETEPAPAPAEPPASDATPSPAQQADPFAQ